MHGLGNDFVVVAEEVEVHPELVRRLCDRRFGVGADGVLRVSLIDDTVTMGYWNADGSEAEMCGNGLRCVARRAADLGLVTGDEFEVRTPIGMRRVRVGEETVSVDLGPVTLGAQVEIEGRSYRCVDVGNPHAVTSADPDRIDLERLGPRVERDPAFPQGTNVEFFERTAPGSFRMRVWERGVGETLACGTGIVAVAAVATADDLLETVAVTVPGGTATVDFTDGAWLSGPAETVFEGRWLSGSS